MKPEEVLLFNNTDLQNIVTPVNVQEFNRFSLSMIVMKENTLLEVSQMVSLLAIVVVERLRRVLQI